MFREPKSKNYFLQNFMIRCSTLLMKKIGKGQFMEYVYVSVEQTFLNVYFSSS